MELSIVVPLAPNEVLDSRLIRNLNELTIATEIILASSDANTLQKAASTELVKVFRGNVSSVKVQGGRAVCMNAGAAKATGTWLLFLHADSYFKEGTLHHLNDKWESANRSGINAISAIYYFNLIFSDGTPLMKINEWGVRFRCFFLKTPFGDQGLCMSKKVFEKIGPYNTQACYGEDHLLIRCARANRVSIKSFKVPIYTSARKYTNNGWLKTTIKHQKMWYIQIFKDRKEKRRTP